MSDEFESVSQQIPVWNPIATKDANDNKIIHKVDEKSYMVGYYLGWREVTDKKNRPYRLHRFLATEIGNPIHDGNAEMKEGGSTREFWGSTVINNMLEENVTEGQLVRVTFLGKEKTQDGSNEYNNFDLGISKNAEPLKVDNMRVVDYDPAPKTDPKDDSAGAPKKEAATQTAAAAEVEEDDSDLPF